MTDKEDVKSDVPVIPVKLDVFVESLVNAVVDRVLPHIIEEHKKNCPLVQRIEILERCKISFSDKVWQVAGYILTSMITAFIFWLLFLYKSH